MPEDIGDERDRAADNEHAAQFTNIAIHIADDTRHAAVEAERGENHRNGRKRQPLLQGEGKQIHFVNVRSQQRQHDYQKNNLGAEEKAVKQIDQ
ncbi:hypothetical protein D3C81_1952380 [compost metagenome]